MEDTATQWPEALVAISAVVTGALLITVIASVAIWQGLISWRARMAVAREGAYQKLAEEATSAQQRAADVIERAFRELAELRQRTAEIERMLKEVD